MKKYFGPSTLVTAAFIGPGTITVCTLAGVTEGYNLLWALVFSTLATLVLQEMSARIGLVTKYGLGKAIQKNSGQGPLGIAMFLLVFGAIFIGSAAYEAGNIGGAVMGADLLINDFQAWPLILGVFAFALLYWGSYKIIEGFLIALVLLISLAFLVSVFLVGPSWNELISQFVPSLEKGTDWFLVIALVGTTVVPYNLFLQSSLVSKKYTSINQLNELRIENAIAIVLGGFISILIVIVAAASREQVGEISSAADLAIQLEPLLGNTANYAIALGLLAAGLSSAITAPLAAALVSNELFNWKGEDDWRFKFVWASILIIGILFSSISFKPILVIKFAQILNGVLLPIIAIYLLVLVNKKELLRHHVNGIWQNILGGIVVVVTFLISAKILYSLF